MSLSPRLCVLFSHSVAAPISPPSDLQPFPRTQTFCSRPGAPVNLAGTYRGQYNMGPLSPHTDPYYVYAESARPGLVATFN